MDFGNSLEKMIGLATGTNDPVAMRAVMDVQRELIQIQEENRKLRLENESLKNKEIERSKIEWRESAYYSKDDKNRVYCPRCYDKEGELINMIKEIPIYSTMYDAQCPECKTSITTDIKHGHNTDVHF